MWCDLLEVDIDFLCTAMMQIAFGLQSLPLSRRGVKKTPLRRTWAVGWPAMYNTTQIQGRTHRILIQPNQT
jgi:hypothetical protein